MGDIFKNKKLDLDTILGYLLPGNIVLSILLYILMTKAPEGLEPREIIYHGLFGLVLLLWFIAVILGCIYICGNLKYSDAKNAKFKRNAIIALTIIICLNIVFAYFLFVAAPVNRTYRGQEYNNGDGTISVKFISILHPNREYISTYKSKYLIYRYRISSEETINYLD